MSGTVEIFAPQEGAERIIRSSAIIIRNLKKVFRIAALVAAIFFLTVFVAVIAAIGSHGQLALIGCM